jgi:predicted enzyme related to lactoylglutathione lyase
MRISHFVILVDDIDEALKFYTEKLGFIKQRETDDLQRDYNELKAKGVNVVTYPEEREWGTEVVFTDLYGNLFVLVQRPKEKQKNFN